MFARTVIAAIMVLGSASVSLASPTANDIVASAPKANRQPLTWRPVMAPLAHVRFCMEHPAQCKRVRVSIRKRNVALTPARLMEIDKVNRTVNAAIRPVSEGTDVTGDRWRIGPAAGDCDDYAVTKRAHLLALGWPSSSLLLTQVSHSAAESHLVLTVRTTGGDFVLDNLHGSARPYVRYAPRVERIQSAINPENWLTTRVRRPVIAQTTPIMETAVPSQETAEVGPDLLPPG